MDPNATLATIRKLALRLQRACEDGLEVDLDDVLELTSALIDLDDWICDKNAPPNAWKRD